MTRLVPIVIAALLGCGGSNKPAPQTPPATPQPPPVAATTPGCDVVSKQIMSTAEDKTEPVHGQLIEAIAKSCIDQKWSDDARKCFMDTPGAEAEKCQEKLTKPQIDALVAVVVEVATKASKQEGQQP